MASNWNTAFRHDINTLQSISLPLKLVTTKRPTTTLAHIAKYLPLFDMGCPVLLYTFQYSVHISASTNIRNIMSDSSSKAISHSRQSTSHIRRWKLFGCEVTVYSVCALCRGYFQNGYSNSWGWWGSTLFLRFILGWFLLQWCRALRTPCSELEKML